MKDLENEFEIWKSNEKLKKNIEKISKNLDLQIKVKVMEIVERKLIQKKSAEYNEILCLSWAVILIKIQLKIRNILVKIHKLRRKLLKKECFPKNFFMSRVYIAI